MPDRGIVLATIGSLGDLHPFIAIGLALKARGAAPVLAVPEDHLAKCRAAGLRAEAILPTFEEVGRATGLADEEVVRRVLADEHFLLGRILLPPLADSVRRLLAIAEGADAIAGSAFTFAAPIAAERLRLPFVNVVLQPMSWFSALDPPTGPRFRAGVAVPRSASARAWNRAILALGTAYVRRRYGARLNRVRTAFGLPPTRAALLVEPGTRPALSLGTYSPAFAPIPPDVAGPAFATGWPWFDSADGRPPVLDPALGRFLDAGPPPLVVSLGSFVPYGAADFYARAARVAGALALRAVLLTGEAAAPSSRDVLALPYAPHSLLFPRAAAIVHHGGIGTTGQALRSGRPQLVAPFMGDQFDNAARVARLGVGLTVRPDRFARDAAGLLRRLFDEPRHARAAARIGTTVAAEDGAAVGADLILTQVRSAITGP